MASAPLPPPLPAAPPATELQQRRGGPTAAPRPVLPQSRPRAEGATPVAHLHKLTNDPRQIHHFARAARSRKRFDEHAIGDAERRETFTLAPVANATVPPLAPLPFPYGYFPGSPPAYGYAQVYPPTWLPGPVLPR